MNGRKSPSVNTSFHSEGAYCLFVSLSLKQEFQTPIVKKTHCPWRRLESFPFTKLFSISRSNYSETLKVEVWPMWMTPSSHCAMCKDELKYFEEKISFFSFLRQKILIFSEESAKWVERSEMTAETLPHRNYNSRAWVKFVVRRRRMEEKNTIWTKMEALYKGNHPHTWLQTFSKKLEPKIFLRNTENKKHPRTLS